MKAFLRSVAAYILLLAALLNPSVASEEITALRPGMKIDEIEAVWGPAHVTDTYGKRLRCYKKDGHTLVCAIDWHEADPRVWGLVEWVEFDRSGHRIAGNIPETDDVWKVMREVDSFGKRPGNSAVQRIHELGGGYFIPGKISSDGWIVEYDIGPVAHPCLEQPDLQVSLLSLAGFLMGLLP